MNEAVLSGRWVRDVPICLPGRECVYQSPVAGPLMGVTSALTPVSAVLAVVSFAVLGVAAIVLAVGLGRRWRGRGSSPRLALLALALLLVGLCSWWTLSARLALIADVYSAAYGQPSAPVPRSLVGAWPTVLGASVATAAVGALALVALTAIVVARARRERTWVH